MTRTVLPAPPARVAAVRTAYETALREGRPSAAQLAWRLGRFERGLKLLGEIAPRVGPLAGKRVLDLGAAHGGDALAALALGMDVCLADFRDFGYARLQRAAAPFGRLESVCFDLNDADWPVPAGMFDAALALSVIEHVHDRRRFFENIARRLRPGGFAVVQVGLALPGVRRDGLFGTPLTSVLPMRLRRMVAERILGRRYSCPLANRTYYSSAGIERPARAAGLAACPGKYADSPIMARLLRWPAAHLWRWIVTRLCADYVLLRLPA